MPSPELNVIHNPHMDKTDKMGKIDGLSNPVQVIAVTGGKGGVGKTSVSVNLATALSASGRRVVLFDGDLGLANADVFLGLSPRYTLAHVISGERTLDEVLVTAPQGFLVVPATSGAADLANMSASEHLGLVQAFSSLAARVDVLIVDTAAGIAHSVLQFSQAAQHVIVVICDEPASLTDAYALVKVLSRNHGVSRFRVVANQVRSAGSGQELFNRFERVTARFLDVMLEFAGEIPEDELLRRSVREQRPVFDAYPGSPAARAFKKLAARADTWPVPPGPRGNIEFFVERLVRRATARLEAVP
jgi:flagellar biosynthesis protein FlhG